MPPILRYPLYMHEVSTNANDNIGIPLLFFAYPQEPVSHFYLLNSVRGFLFFDTKKEILWKLHRNEYFTNGKQKCIAMKKSQFPIFNTISISKVWESVTSKKSLIIMKKSQFPIFTTISITKVWMAKCVLAAKSQ